MANQFLTTKEIARAMLPILQDNLVFPALAYTDYSDTFSKKGDTIQVKKPPVYVADEFSDNISVQDVKEESVLVTLDKIADVSVGDKITVKVRDGEIYAGVSGTVAADTSVSKK